jgi:hypothetical protein
VQIAIIRLINIVIEKIGHAIELLLALLPDSPFLWVERIDSKVLDAINYVIPIPAIISHLQVYVMAVALYYAIRIALRWAKAAGG